MRLYKFLSLSSTDEDVNIFRSLNLDLVEESTGNVDVVRRVNEKYQLDDSALVLLERANKELKKMYRGKMVFDFCVEEQGFAPEQIRIEKSKTKQLKEKWFRFNDELSDIQNNFEHILRKSLHK